MTLAPHITRTKSVETVLPWLYLKGISTGDFSEALAALLGKNAKGLSAGTISRLKQCWVNEYDDWRTRDLSKEGFISGQMAFISTSGVMMRNNAFSLLLA